MICHPYVRPIYPLPIGQYFVSPSRRAGRLTVYMYKEGLQLAGNAPNYIIRAMLVLVLQWKEHYFLTAPMPNRIELLEAS